MRMTSKIVLNIDQKSMKNRPKMGHKINLFSDCLGDGCRLRFGADLGTILGPMLGRFSDPKAKQKHVEKTATKNTNQKNQFSNFVFPYFSLLDAKVEYG